MNIAAQRAKDKMLLVFGNCVLSYVTKVQFTISAKTVTASDYIVS